MPIESWPFSCCRDLVCVRDWYLTAWGRVTHICVGNLTTIGSDDGLSPGWHQAINWTNAGILLVGRWGTNFINISIQLLAFSFKKMRLKVSTAKWWLFFSASMCRDYHLPFLHQHWFYGNGFGGANKHSLTFRSLWDVAVISKVHFSNSLYRTLACEIAPRWMPQNITYVWKLKISPSSPFTNRINLSSPFPKNLKHAHKVRWCYPFPNRLAERKQG